MPVSRALYAGSPYLGVYLRVSDRIALLPPSVPPALERDVARILGTTTARTTIQDNDVVGAMVALNSHGTVVAEGLDPAEEAALRATGPLTVVASRHNALGNNILVNDSGALVHPEFSDNVVHGVEKGLGVPVRRGTIAGLGTVGMAGVATNRGVVVHPRATESEVAVLAELLKVPVHRSTANFGVPIVGANLVANSRGLITGLPTTPVEIVHLQEGLQIFD